MSDRLKGTLLLLTGILVVAGVSQGNLPAMSFWLGLVLYPIGGYLFLKGNRHAHDRLERRTQRALSPTIRSQSARAFVQQQVDRAGGGQAALAAAAPLAPPLAPAGEIALTEADVDHGRLDLDTESSSASDPDFKVSEDVSFPIEVQERTLIADDLRKLVRLFEDGVISDQEFDAAKAKLLR